MSFNERVLGHLKILLALYDEQIAKQHPDSFLRPEIIAKRNELAKFIDEITIVQRRRNGEKP